MFQSISPGSVDTEIFNTAKFRPSSQTVSSRPALKPEDVAAMVITTLETPPSVEVCLINYNYIILIFNTRNISKPAHNLFTYSTC